MYGWIESGEAGEPIWQRAREWEDRYRVSTATESSDSAVSHVGRAWVSFCARKWCRHLSISGVNHAPLLAVPDRVTNNLFA